MDFRDVIELSAKCTVARILERDDFKNRYETGKPISDDNIGMLSNDLVTYNKNIAKIKNQQ